MSYYNKNLNKRIAYDICPCNILTNYLANLKGLEYDKDGNLAKKGEINDILLLKLSN